MKSMLRKAHARLRDKQGFMLAEQMLAVLLLGFLSLAVAAGLGVCIKVQRDISTEAQAQSLLTIAIQEVDDQLEFSIDPDEQQARFVSATLHQKVQFGSSSDQGIVLTQLDVPDTEILLVGEKNGLYAVFAEGGAPAYDVASNAWTYAIDIVKASGSVVKTQHVAVKRIGAAPAA